MNGAISTTPQAKPLGLTRTFAAHPMLAYTLIAYLGTWLLLLPMVLGRDGLGLLSYNVPFPIYAVLFLLSSYTGPTLGAFLVVGAMEGSAGRRKLLSRYALWRVGIQWYLIAIFGLPLIYLLVISILNGSFPLAELMANKFSFFTAYLPALLIFPALITWGEEPGWRGFALTHMEAVTKPWLAAIVVGILHAFWHLPVFLMVNGPVALGPFDLNRFLLNSVGIVSLTLIWTWVFNNARGSILIAVLLHSSSNASLAWLARILPSLPKNTGQVTFAVYIGIALILLIATRAKLSYKPGFAGQLGEQEREDSA